MSWAGEQRRIRLAALHTPAARLLGCPDSPAQPVCTGGQAGQHSGRQRSGERKPRLWQARLCPQARSRSRTRGARASSRNRTAPCLYQPMAVTTAAICHRCQAGRGAARNRPGRAHARQCRQKGLDRRRGDGARPLGCSVWTQQPRGRCQHSPAGRGCLGVDHEQDVGRGGGCRQRGYPLRRGRRWSRPRMQGPRHKKPVGDEPHQDGPDEEDSGEQQNGSGRACASMRPHDCHGLRPCSGQSSAWGAHSNRSPCSVWLAEMAPTGNSIT